jgi:TolA-binding protein
MQYQKVIKFLVVFFLIHSLSAQKTLIYTNNLNAYNQAVELYQNKAYTAAQEKFNLLINNFDATSEIRANCAYYAANCAIRLGQPNGDDLMQQFVDNYPTSTKRNNAFIDVADYYFKTGKYAYAAKWYKKVNTTNLTLKKEEEYNFNYAYSLFSSKNYTEAKRYFLPILDSQEYGSQAKYYYGYIAYNQDDYATAATYLEEVENNESFKGDVSYYLADINFKLGKFEEALNNGLPLLEKVRGVDHSELSKIIGESYFNLKKYDEAIPHLNNYKGKRGKWNNTDYYLLGYAYYKQNDFENAISNFNKIVSGNNGVAQNAYYHLGECYLKLNQKSEALNAFRNASQMKFEPEIQRDAWLNYAKLSYEIGNPYKSVPEVLSEYIDTYPNSPHKTEIQDLIISAYITSNDFQGALDYLKNKKSQKERKLYQQVAFYRGIELFNTGNYNNAKELFTNAITEPIDAQITAQATFWKAESNYNLNNFTDALNDFLAFTKNPAAENTAEFEYANYHIGYTYFKLKDYSNATNFFKKYIAENSNDSAKINDSNLRLGDGFFAERNYTNAINYYNKVIEQNAPDADYAQFQKAVSYGLIGNENSKIQELNLFLNKHLKSNYRDDALFVLGNSYIKTGNNSQALSSFDNLINNYKRSPLVSQALLRKGLIYYNTDQNNEAISTYKNIVSRFPKTAEANQAVKNLRQIYVDLGRADEYASWVKTVDFVNVTDAELDNDMYASAEKQFLQNNHKKAISSFKSYLKSFPAGLHALQANFYLAQSLFSENLKSEAIAYYTTVTNFQQNEFTEVALQQLSIIYLENNNWGTAIPILERLEQESNTEQNINFAQSNLMKGFYATEQYSKAVNYAKNVLQNPKVDNRIKSDAHIIIARSAIKTNDEETARKAYKEVEQIAAGELKAESLYYSAYFENQDGSYRVSNQIIQNLASDYAAYKYWSAKGLIVMAKNHYQLKDAFQATYILESVIKNFTQFQDVVEEATAELSKIKTEQAKTNESVNPNQN